MAIAPANTDLLELLRADAADPRLRDRGRAPVQGGQDRRLLPSLLGTGGDLRRRDRRDARGRPARHRLSRRMASRSRAARRPRRSWPSCSASATAARTAAAARCTCSTPSRGYYGGWGIVGGQLPLATGLALALVRQGKQQAVVCELGDGAVNMGAWHESLNLAALWKLPVVFLVVNNKYGMGTAVDRASAEPELYKRASAYRMHGEAVDGDDLEARDRGVLAAARAGPRGARAGGARGDDLPLPRPLRRRRRARVPDEGGDRRAPGAATRCCASRRACATPAPRPTSCARSTSASRSASRRRSSSRTESPDPDVGALAWAMHAQGSDEQFERMRPGSPFGEEELVFDGGLGK